MGIFLAALLAFAAQESPSQVVWKWRPGDTNCVLRQSVAPGQFLDIGTQPGSNEIGLRIVDTQARTRSSKAIKAIDVQLSPGHSVKRDGFIEPNKDPVGRTTYVFLALDDLPLLASASAVDLSHTEIGSLHIALQSPAAALDAIRACDERKLKEWGIDIAAWRSLSAKPAPATPTEKWLSWFDYPDREKIYKNDIEVVARLDVGADGAVLNCTVVNHPPKEFIPAACNALMRNAKFTPARDAKGQAVAAPYLLQVNFAAYYL